MGLETFVPLTIVTIVGMIMSWHSSTYKNLLLKQWRNILDKEEYKRKLDTQLSISDRDDTVHASIYEVLDRRKEELYALRDFIEQNNVPKSLSKKILPGLEEALLEVSSDSSIINHLLYSDTKKTPET